MGERIKNFNNVMRNPKTRNGFFALVGVSAVMAIVGFVWVSKQKEKDTIPTNVNVATSPSITSIPGSSESQRYNEMVQKSNDAKTEGALNKGETFVPTIINNQFNAASPIDMLSLEEQKKREKMELDDKERQARDKMEKMALESLAPPPPPTVIAPPVQQPVVVAAPAPVPEEKKLKWTAEDYILIGALQESWKNKAPSSEFDYFGKQSQNRNQTVNNTGVSNSNSQLRTSNAQVSNVQVPDQKAGDIIHAVLDTGVNSDEQSPVMATVVAGQFKGAKLLGRFVRTNKRVVIQFNTMSVPNFPTSVKLNVVAVDPDTKKSNMATDVDNHYFLRYAVLTAATFLRGYSRAIANQGTSTTVTPAGTIIQTQDELSSSQINKRALGEVGEELASQTKQTINGLEPTVYVEAGTPMGLMFMDDFYLKQNR
jgi:hypothetical protein